MHIIDDRPNGILLNHPLEWDGEVRLVWYVADERRDLSFGPGSIPPSMKECRCSGADLVAGRFTPLYGSEPPVNVITRAVALAVEDYLRSRAAKALEDLHIRHERL